MIDARTHHNVSDIIYVYIFFAMYTEAEGTS